MLQQRQSLKSEGMNNVMAVKLTAWYLSFFVIGLLFDRFYSGLALVAFGIHVLIYLSRERLRFLSHETVFLSSLYIFTLLASLYSEDKKEAGAFIGRQVAFIIFPVGLTLLRDHLVIKRKLILAVFSWTTFLVMCILFIRILSIIIGNDLGVNSIWSPKFTNHNFSVIIDLHATYFSMYLFMAFMFFVQQFFSTQKNGMKALYACVGFLCLFGFLQLFSRAVCIALLIGIIFIIPFYFVAARHRLAYILISFITAGILFFLILNKSELKERYVVDLKEDLSSDISLNNAGEPRAVRWKCAVDIFRESPVWGHGTGDEKKLLMQKYYERNLYISYINKLNAHNQYLSYMIKGGVIGLALYLTYLFAGFKRALRKRDFMYLSFLMLIAVVSFSENILNVNKGIFFVSFFYTFFWLTSGKRLDNEYIPD